MNTRTAWILAAVLAAPMAGSVRAVEGGAEHAILEGLWRTQEEIVLRSRHYQGAEAEAEAFTTAVRSHLRAIRRETRRQGARARSALGRKIAAVETLLRAGGASEGELPSPRPLPGRPSSQIVPSAGCEGAPAMEPGTVEWFEGTWTPDPGRVHFDRDAWVRFDARATGRLVVHTGGSHADTEIAVFERCGARPVAENDDAVGLQSVVGLDAVAGRSYRIRVRTLVGHPTDPVRLTVGPSGGISGTVVTEDEGEPVVGIRVSAYDANGSLESTAFTSTDGSYTIDGLDDGALFVRTRFASPFLDELWDDHPCSPDCDETEGDQVSVKSGAVTAGVDFALPLGGSLTGRIRDAATGLPLASYDVEIYSATGEQLDFSGTDEAGRYRVEGLASGTVRAATGDSGPYRDELYDNLPCEPDCDPTTGTPIIIQQGLTTSEIDFDLELGGVISGQAVASGTGSGIAFAQLTITDQAGQYLDDQTADASGYYSFGGLDDGNYRIYTSDSRFRNEVWDDVPCPTIDCDPLTGDLVSATVGQTTGGIDFALDPLGGIAGTVGATGAGVPTGFVDIFTGGGFPTEGADLDALGRWAVPYLFPGDYRAATQVEAPYLDELYDDFPCPTGPPDGCDPIDGDPISVPLGAFVTGIDFLLDTGGAITGTVRDAWTGEPVFSSVTAWSADDIVAGGATTESDGHFRIEPLPRRKLLPDDEPVLPLRSAL
ncbi:MAG: carboxypeptidase-like regulatory domain-containing protein [Thermoanaerobaculia bacterium]